MLSLEHRQFSGVSRACSVHKTRQHRHFNVDKVCITLWRSASGFDEFLSRH